MKNIKEKMQKIGKFIASRMFYLILGISVAVAIPIAYAAWNSSVSSGQTLTATGWNEHVNKLIELNNRSLQCVQKSLVGGNFNGQTLNCDAGYTITGGGCVWRSDGNDQLVYSKPNGNGWFCKDNDFALITEIWAVCCKI